MRRKFVFETLSPHPLQAVPSTFAKQTRYEAKRSCFSFQEKNRKNIKQRTKNSIKRLTLFLTCVIFCGEDEGALFEAEGTAARDTDKLGAALYGMAVDVVVV